MEYLATAEYVTPGGNIKTWSAMIEAPDIQTASTLAEQKLRSQRRVRKCWHISVQAPL